MADVEKVVDINQQIRLDKKEIIEGCYNVLRTEDPRAQYICGTKGFKEDVETEYTPISRVDYGVNKAETEEDKNDLEN